MSVVVLPSPDLEPRERTILARWSAVFRGVVDDAGFIAEEATPAENPIGLRAGDESVFGRVSARVRRRGAKGDGVVVSPAVREVSDNQPCAGGGPKSSRDAAEPLPR
jgi:hypothetical protein